MPARQMLLFPDPRPLVERLGADFFRALPESPGVYLMHDAREAVLYVGKAKNLRKRLNSYRVANPERLRRRHLRLLRVVVRIECESCVDERAALVREAALIRELKPPFNRAGAWPAPPRFFCWRVSQGGLEIGLFDQAESDWSSQGPLGGGAVHVYAALARLIWLAINPGRSVAELPPGWTAGELDRKVRLLCETTRSVAANLFIAELFGGNAEPLSVWLRDRNAIHPFDLAVMEEDLESLRRRFSPGPITLEPG